MFQAATTVATSVCTKTVVFFDICAYSEKSLEDQRACIEVLEETIHTFLPNLGDFVIVEGGDSFAIGFDDAQSALMFTITLASAVRQNTDIAFDIRTGVYTGEVSINTTINNVRNLYGKGIDYAARITSCCLPGQILVAAHIIDNILGNNNRFKPYLAGKGVYTVKHGETVELYNLYSSSQGFGVPDLPLKRKADNHPFLLLLGERRETPPCTVADMFCGTPSIDDICHMFTLDWPDDIMIRADKLMCWEYRNTKGITRERNIIAIGSPKVNIASLLVNAGAFFNFKVEKDIYDTVHAVYDRYSRLPKNDQNFRDWCKSPEGERLLRQYPKKFGTLEIIDPLNDDHPWVWENDETFGLISFARHPFVTDGSRYAIFIAGVNLCATNTLFAMLRHLDFSQRPFGGVIRISHEHNDCWGWYEEPHHGSIELENDACWVTPPYTADQLKLRVDRPRQELIYQLSVPGIQLTMSRIQALLRKSK